MNPHFIFNALNTVQQLILVKEEQQGLDYLSDFAMLMRQMLENSSKPYITLSEEIEFLKCYMQLEAIRFNNKFEFKIDVDNNLLPDEIKVPPVLLQPLLENAVKHGISAMKNKGLIKLEIRKDGNFLVAIIEDNGIGIYSRKERSTLNKKKQPTALKLLEERLKLIKNIKDFSSIQIIDKSKEDCNTNGTIIKIRIPILT